MLAMTGTLAVSDAPERASLPRRLHRYRTIRVSESQRVVLIPPIGSFLVDWDRELIRLHIAANSARDLDELVGELDRELRKCGELQRLVWSQPSPLVLHGD